jgi:hypothetical protein
MKHIKKFHSEKIFLTVSLDLDPDPQLDSDPDPHSSKRLILYADPKHWYRHRYRFLGLLLPVF